MENIKETLLNFNENDYKNDINLHIHTTFSDGKSTPEQILSQAKALGMKKIAICDHNTVQAYLENNVLYNFSILLSFHLNLPLPCIQF